MRRGRKAAGRTERRCNSALWAHSGRPSLERSVCGTPYTHSPPSPRPGMGRCASLGAPLQPDPRAEDSVCLHLHQPWLGPAATGGVSRGNPARDAQGPQSEPVSELKLPPDRECAQSGAYMWLFTDTHVMWKHTCGLCTYVYIHVRSLFPETSVEHLS